MRKVIIILAVCLSAVVCISVPASAKEGFYIGGALDYVSITGSDPWFDTVDPGMGFDLKLGWDFGPVALESTLIGSSHEDSAFGYEDGDFSGLTLDLRVMFGPPDAMTRGFMLVGFGAYAFSQDTFSGNEYIFSGGGFNLGGGVEHFLNDVVALDMRAVYRIIAYDELEYNGVVGSIPDMDADTFNLSIGLSLHF